MKTPHTVQDTFAGYDVLYAKQEVEILSIDPQPQKTNSTYGNWCVVYEARFLCRYGQPIITVYKDFMRKKEALEWIELSQAHIKQRNHKEGKDETTPRR